MVNAVSNLPLPAEQQRQLLEDTFLQLVNVSDPAALPDSNILRAFAERRDMWALLTDAAEITQTQGFARFQLGSTLPDGLDDEDNTWALNLTHTLEGDPALHEKVDGWSANNDDLRQILFKWSRKRLLAPTQRDLPHALRPMIERWWRPEDLPTLRPMVFGQALEAHWRAQQAPSPDDLTTADRSRKRPRP